MAKEKPSTPTRELLRWSYLHQARVREDKKSGVDFWGLLPLLLILVGLAVYTLVTGKAIWR